MSNNKYSENLNQSGINQQQQQDLMQAAALMFPSLFMAQQFTSSPLNTQSAQQNQHVLLQTLQRQQQTSSSCQLNQQQQQTEQTNKILASLIQQQSINQMATNDWLQLLNNQANCGRQTSISQHLRHTSNEVNGSNGTLNGTSNKSQLTSKNNQISNNGTNTQNRLSNYNTDLTSYQTSKKISLLQDTATPKTNSKVDHKHPGKSKKQNTSLFSIKDLIGASQALSDTPKKQETLKAVANDLNLVISKNKNKQEQQTSSNKTLTPIQSGAAVTKTEQNKKPMNQNDQLLMFAAAAAVVQGNNSNLFKQAAAATTSSTASSNVQCYDWLMPMSQHQNVQQSNETRTHGKKQQLNKHCKSKISAIYEANGLIDSQNGFHDNADMIETKIKIPLNYGWRRETIVKEITKNGVKGDVIYYSPCSKKLRNFQEIERYLNKNNSGKLTRDNFTFSSKLLVGVFLQLKDPNCTTWDDPNDTEKVRQNLKFNIFTEDEIIAKICEINPNFRNRSLNQKCTTHSPRTVETLDDTTDNKSVKSTIQQACTNSSTVYDFNERHEILQACKSESNLENSLYERHQLEQKSQEKALFKARKIREKWFEYILAREQHSPKYQLQQIVNSCDEGFSSGDYSSKPFDTIDDMQEKYAKDMPEFESLLDCGWVGDCLQVVEFLVTFGDKLKESLQQEDEDGGKSDVTKVESFSNVLASVESFRLGIEKKNEKSSREIAQIVQLLLRCLINTIGSPSNINTTDTTQDTCASDFFLIDKLTIIECTDLTYSELLRLYIQRSQSFLTRRRQLTLNKFNIDVTLDLHNQLDVYLTSLATATFPHLTPKLKCSIMAYLCDELLATSPVTDLNSLQSHTQDILIANDDDDQSCVVYELNEAIDQFHSLKQEICQLDSKRRQLRTEKQMAIANMHTNPEETNKVKQQKVMNKLDKTLGQLEKKRIQLKQDSDGYSAKLRSGKHLGQDRFARHYWSLNNAGGVFVEAGSRAKPGSVYLSDDSKLLVDEEGCVSVEGDIINDVVTEMVDKVVEECGQEIKFSDEKLRDHTLQNNETNVSSTLDTTVSKFGHLIDRLQLDNPFKLALNSQHPDCTKLSFYQIEQLIQHHIQFKQPQRIPPDYLANSSDQVQWWRCDTQLLLKQLNDCLVKRGYREKALAKCFNKLCEENPLNADNDQTTHSNNAIMFDKLSSLFKDLNKTNGKNCDKKQIYREQIKALKYVYALEDRVFGANLQQPAVNDKPIKMTDRKNLSDGDSESEQPIDVAVERLEELERRIERRYLKYPFVPKKKLKLPKLNSSEDEVVEHAADVQKPVMPTKELEQWRDLVSRCKTTSQLYILVDELNEAIAWDKSIMKVICQICNSDENEAQLLLCDNCDKGNHTYCFKPQLSLENIPAGDWYCFVCIGLLSEGQKLCCVCGSSEPFCLYESHTSRNLTNDMNKCDKCSKHFHGQCLPNAKYIKSTRKWQCLNCSKITKVLKTNSQLHNAEKVESEETSLKRSNINSDRKPSKKLKTMEQETPTEIVNKKTRKNKGTGRLKIPMPVKRLSKAGTKDFDTDHNSSIDDGHSETTKFNSEQENSNSVNVNDSLTIKKFPKKVQVKKSRKAPKKNKPLDINVKATTQVSTPPATPPNHVVRERDLAMCKLIINEMCKNDSATAFMEKVNEKDYPDYYELIKQPMDIETIKTKLKNREYKTKEQFAYDCRLIFDNCEFFNEDESKVGQAGHKLRAYFETKFMKIFD